MQINKKRVIINQENKKFISEQGFNNLMLKSDFISNGIITQLLKMYEDRMKEISEMSIDVEPQPIQQQQSVEFKLQLDTFGKEYINETKPQENVENQQIGDDYDPDPEEIRELMRHPKIREQLETINNSIHHTIAYDMMKYLPYPLVEIANCAIAKRKSKNNIHISQSI